MDDKGLEPPTYSPSSNIMSDIVFKISTILKIIRNFEINYFAGPDDILTMLIKKCAPELVPVLAIFFKISYNTRIFSKTWKLARMQPIKKKGDSSNIKNYLTIATTSVLSKINMPSNPFTVMQMAATSRPRRTFTSTLLFLVINFFFSSGMQASSKIHMGFILLVRDSCI